MGVSKVEEFPFELEFMVGEESGKVEEEFGNDEESDVAGTEEKPSDVESLGFVPQEISNKVVNKIGIYFFIVLPLKIMIIKKKEKCFLFLLYRLISAGFHLNQAHYFRYYKKQYQKMLLLEQYIVQSLALLS